MSETEQWITTSCDIPTTQENLDFIEKLVRDKYFVKEYMLALENDPKEHIHLVGFTAKKNWNNFVKTLVDKWKLRATDGAHGGKRKYATLTAPIRTAERLMIYMTKQSEGDFTQIRTNIDPAKVQILYDQSFKKTQKNKLRDDVHEALEAIQHKPYEASSKTYAVSDSNYMPNLCDDIVMDLKYNIINYLRITGDINISRTLVNSSLSFHLKNTNHYDANPKNWLLYHINK